MLASLRTKFAALVKDGSLILSRTQITDSFGHNASRRNATPINHIYNQLIPYLIKAGDAKLLKKEGKKEIYAFRADD